MIEPCPRCGEPLQEDRRIPFPDGSVKVVFTCSGRPPHTLVRQEGM